MDRSDKGRMHRRDFLVTTAVILAACGTLGFPSPAVKTPILIRNRFSPLNSKRPYRTHTQYIILHTSEGEDGGSLNKIIRNGEANYFVSSSGVVYRIIDKAKIAKHAGRSMWNGQTGIDDISIGIEVAGYHNRDIKEAQYSALRELLRQLKSLYGISDDCILTHSMVAYGRPNRFQEDNHRGRKRCGMIFARPDVRERLGLGPGPDHDPDVQAGRLKVADPELFAFLFKSRPEPVLVAKAEKALPDSPPPIEMPPESNRIDGYWTAWRIARDRYDHPSTIYVFPDGRRLAGNQIRDWKQIPVGTSVLLNEAEDTQPFEGFLEVGKDGDTAREIAGAAYASATTIYFFPDGYIRTGAELQKRPSLRKLLNNPPKGTRILVGYVYGGHVKGHRRPSRIAGRKWNYPSTYYRYPDGTILSGDDVDPKSIPSGTLVFFQH